jgi:hypothetical protein
MKDKCETTSAQRPNTLERAAEPFAFELRRSVAERTVTNYVAGKLRVHLLESVRLRRQRWSLAVR